MKQKKQEKTSDNEQKNSLLKLIHDRFKLLGWKQRDLVKKTGIDRGPISKLIKGSPTGVFQDQIGMEAAYKILSTLGLLKTVSNEAEMSELYASDEIMQKYKFLKYLIPAIQDDDPQMIEQALRKAFKDIIGEQVERKELGTQQEFGRNKTKAG